MQVTGCGRSGSAGIGTLAVGEYVVEGAQVGRRRSFACIETRIASLLALLSPQRLQFDRAGDETDVRALLHQPPDPPVIVVLLLNSVPFKENVQFQLGEIQFRPSGFKNRWGTKKINRKSQSHLATIQPTDEMSNVELVVRTAIEHVFWLKNSKVITLICKKSLTLKETALP